MNNNNSEEKTKNNNEDGEIIKSGSSFESFDRDIYFYNEFNSNTNFKLNKDIKKIDKQINCFKINNEIDVEIPIRLHIQSYGGVVLSCFGSIDYIRSSTNPVHTYVDGYAASCGALMSIVGHKRFISENGWMLIHQISGGSWGTFENMKDNMKNFESLMKSLKDIFDKYCKIPKKELDDILQRDIWWDAETCLKYGLVDEIIASK